jgi:hypothetical protein
VVETVALQQQEAMAQMGAGLAAEAQGSTVFSRT